MGWKCPDCGNHVYDRSQQAKCPYCNPVKCELCNRRERVSRIHNHHISYEYDITIGVCQDCHQKIHFQEERSDQDPDNELDRLNPLEV